MTEANSFVQSLPAKPNLEKQKKWAKELLRALREGDLEATARFKALHPNCRSAELMKLADAQLVVARSYGFDSWPKLKEKIVGLSKSPLEAWKDAVLAGDADRVRELLDKNPEVRKSVNEPIFAFGGRAAQISGNNLSLIDVLLEYGADLNLKSEWWAGGFGILESADSEVVDALIERGALVDVWAAAKLNRFDRLKQLVEADPTLINAKGGDGKRPLHYAQTVEIAEYLLQHGAEIDARCVDHQSTAAQYHCVRLSEVARYLVDQGAWSDIFMAVALRDFDLIRRHLRDDPEALDHRLWQGKYAVNHDIPAAEACEPIGDLRGDIYRWEFGHNTSVLDVVRKNGDDEFATLLLKHANPAQRLLDACGRGDRATAEVIQAEQSDLISTLTHTERRVIVDRAHANDAAGVKLMMDLGFDPNVPGVDGVGCIYWAGFHGNADMMEALLRGSIKQPINEKDKNYNSSPLGWAIHGSMNSWERANGDYPRTVQLLADAGAAFTEAWPPTGNEGIDEVLRLKLKDKP